MGKVSVAGEKGIKFMNTEKMRSQKGYWCNLIICTIIIEETEEEKMKVHFTNDIGMKTQHENLLPLNQGDGMVCTIDAETFHAFMKNTLIWDCGTTCHITNNYTGFCDVTKVNELVQGSSWSMSAMKKGKCWLKVRQVDEIKKVYVPSLMKYCARAGTNWFLLTSKLSQGNKIFLDNKIILWSKQLMATSSRSPH